MQISALRDDIAYRFTNSKAAPASPHRGVARGRAGLAPARMSAHIDGLLVAGERPSSTFGVDQISIATGRRQGELLVADEGI